jgi:putative hemolysin
MKMLLVSSLLLLLVAGCVSVSPPFSVGDNAYLISVVSHAQWKEAIESGVNQANQFCANKGLRATVTNTSTAGTDFMSSSKAQVWFSCTR